MFYIVSLLIFGIDILLKRLTVNFLQPAQSIPALKGIFHFTYVRNTGVAFGFLQGQRLPLILIGIIVCVIVVYFYRKAENDILLKVSLALILGGSLGNLYDRIFFGYVIDYLDFRFFPVFNFADIAINLGIFLIIIDLFFRRAECIQ